MTITITEFNKLVEKYGGKVPVYKMFFHFPFATIEDITDFVNQHRNYLKIENGFIVLW